MLFDIQGLQWLPFNIRLDSIGEQENETLYKKFKDCKNIYSEVINTL